MNLWESKLRSIAMINNIDKVGDMLDIDQEIYDLEWSWRVKNPLWRATVEKRGIELANLRKALLVDLSDGERERYYQRRIVQVIEDENGD